MNLSGSPFDYLAAFLGGVVVSFSPCVYPLVPVSASFIGIEAGSSKLKALSLSLTYVTGVAVTYSLLGVFASLTGKIFGMVASHPGTYILAGAVIVIFGLSMFDLFNFYLPNIIKLPVGRKKGYFSAFFLGLVSGLVISPCTTPVLGSILIYLAAKKNIFYGATLLFSFAYGMGLILIIAGTFSSIILALPKSGKWMVYLKKFAAVVLLGMGAYFIFSGIRRL